MTPTRYKFRLSPTEVDYLGRLTSLDSDLFGILQTQLKTSGQPIVIELGLDDVERLRSYLTEQLARIGFEDDYTLTKDGAMLEVFIDKFYIP